MPPNLQHVHQQLMEIAKETQDVSKTSYTMKDIQHLQNKLHHIDEQYKEGMIDDRTDKSNVEDDPYEHPGQAQIADVSSNSSWQILNALYTSYKLLRRSIPLCPVC
ncbi:hypothetical protein BDA99DRAFT_539827 [Phascolomyces articulosus]|uniref:Uncharacterized protein n=1 Tax=Phascolomyces articulosus TaxID=60185 RepID=A0AAD5K5N4_9FUNG|nr:hypothetical protein BDA99DRAFT_539827 [Phascolomyces articulosus]